MKKSIIIGFTAITFASYANTWQIAPDKTQYEVTGAVKTIKQCFLDEKQIEKLDKEEAKKPSCDWQVINHFNAKGNLTKRDFVSRGFYWDYTYKIDNDLTRIDFYDRENVPTHVILSVKTATNDEGTLRKVYYPKDYNYQLYDIVPVEKASLGHLDIHHVYSPVEHQYDQAGRLINTQYYSYYAGRLSTVDKRKIDYDKKGRMALILYRGEGAAAPMNYFDYDDNGQLISERRANRMETRRNAAIYKNQYTKDNKGNWIELQQFRDGKLVGITQRDIEYHSEQDEVK